MPTYDYRCCHCGSETSVFQTIGQYSANPLVPTCPVCPGLPGVPMERKLSVVPGMSGLANALAGDRHYDGLVATDGTDISTRTKHRQYMKQHGLTMVDDFKNTWAQAQKEREALRTGTFQDKHLRETISQEVTKAIAG